MARFFGFDLGDGESAVCFLASDAKANVSPQAVRVFGENCFISTYGLSKNNKVLLGGKAIKGAVPTSLHARFKRNYLNNPKETAEEIKTFARAVHDDLDATGQDIDAEDVTVAVGCPSSWDERTRSEYKSIFEDSGFKNVRVISESRAAFIFSKQAGLCDYANLQKFVLIIDAGSSTMDLTLVDSFVPIDFGHPKLGAGLIDQELLLLNETREEKLHNILTDYPAWRARHELDARKLKEEYFNEETQTKKNEPVETVQSIIITIDGNLTITCSQEDMRQILHTKLEELNGDTFLEAYEKCLRNVKELCLQENELGAIILTGGASRMSFIRAMAEEAFPGVKVIQGNEPELSIAQGLAYTLSIDERVKNFRNEIDELTKPGGQIENLIKDNLNVLFSEVVGPIVNEMIESIILPEFKRWKAHEIKTLDDMEASIKEKTKVHFENEGKEVMEPLVSEWLETVGDEIDQLTDPICREHNINPGGLKLNFRSIGGIGINDSGINPEQFLLVQILQYVVKAIIAIIIMSLVLTLGATGPIGIAGAIIAYLFSIIYTDDAIKDFIKSADISGVIRFFVSEDRVKGKLYDTTQQESMKKDVYDHMLQDLAKPTEEMKNLYTGILTDLKKVIDEKVEKVAVLIN